MTITLEEAKAFAQRHGMTGIGVGQLEALVETRARVLTFTIRSSQFSTLFWAWLDETALKDLEKERQDHIVWRLQRDFPHLTVEDAERCAREADHRQTPYERAPIVYAEAEADMMAFVSAMEKEFPELDNRLCLQLFVREDTRTRRA